MTLVHFLSLQARILQRKDPSASANWVKVTGPRSLQARFRINAVNPTKAIVEIDKAGGEKEKRSYEAVLMMLTSGRTLDFRIYLRLEDGKGWTTTTSKKDINKVVCAAPSMANSSSGTSLLPDSSSGTM